MMGGELKYFIFSFFIITQVNGLNIGSIFTGKKGEGEEIISDEDAKQTARDPATRPPLIPALPHPDDHPLHPNNDPNHPLNNLPFNHQARPTITATKTVYVEVTSRVTKHPVCIEVQGVKPPCLAAPTKYHHGYNYHDTHASAPGYSEPGYFREGGQEIDFNINPTASVQLEPTRILGGVSESAAAPSELAGEYDESDFDARSERYLKLNGATPTAPLRSESAIQEAAAEGEPTGRIIEQLLNRQPEVHYATKTLWVTKVEKFIDYRVTATLEVKNCVPNEFRFPQCEKIYPHPHPHPPPHVTHPPPPHPPPHVTHPPPPHPPPPPPPSKPHKPTSYHPQHQNNVHYQVPYQYEEEIKDQHEEPTSDKKNEKVWAEQPVVDDVSFEV